jgi:hypothetical protein
MVGSGLPVEDVSFIVNSQSTTDKGPFVGSCGLTARRGLTKEDGFHVVNRQSTIGNRQLRV